MFDVSSWLLRLCLMLQLVRLRTMAESLVRLRTRYGGTVDFVVFVATVVVVVAIVQCNWHVLRLRMRPNRCCRCATQPACRALAHEAS